VPPGPTEAEENKQSTTLNQCPEICFEGTYREVAVYSQRRCSSNLISQERKSVRCCCFGQVIQGQQRHILPEASRLPPRQRQVENIAKKLFQMKYVNNLSIILNVKHIRDEVYIKERLAEATDRVPGFSLRCVEGFQSIHN
jgi:hypothetical protein